jgi:ParB-like chromosome segregation protein Spo0J
MAEIEMGQQVSSELVERLVDQQPVCTVRWVQRDLLEANDYNPNHVAPLEFELLKTSIIEDGWTQPIVVRSKNGNGRYKIVDGFHRWSVAADPDVEAMTDGLVPVVVLSDERSKTDQMMSTIRHNRARGQHAVLKMADIVIELQKQGLSGAEICKRLGMEEEELERLSDQRGMPVRGSNAEDFHKGWVPE